MTSYRLNDTYSVLVQNTLVEEEIVQALLKRICYNTPILATSELGWWTVNGREAYIALVSREQGDGRCVYAAVRDLSNKDGSINIVDFEDCSGPFGQARIIEKVKE